jgi:hypothetical protein
VQARGCKRRDTSTHRIERKGPVHLRRKRVVHRLVNQGQDIPRDTLHPALNEMLRDGFGRQVEEICHSGDLIEAACRAAVEMVAAEFADEVCIDVER